MRVALKVHESPEEIRRVLEDDRRAIEQSKIWEADYRIRAHQAWEAIRTVRNDLRRHAGMPPLPDP
jgi:hypothetical protein